MQDQYSNIRETLQNISAGLGSLSAEDKKKFEASDTSESLKGTLGALGGVVSSERAAKKVKDASQVVDDETRKARADALADLRRQNQALQKDLEKERVARETAEADISLAEQTAEKEGLADMLAKVKSGEAPDEADVTKPEEEIGEAAPQISTEEDKTAQDVAEALAANLTEQIRIAKSQMDEMRSFIDETEEDTHALIDEIEKSRELAQERQKKENERLVRASRVAGITGGRAMYSPEEHEGIISEVIQSGNSLLAEIDIKAAEEKRKARESLRDLKYKAFTESADIISKLSELKKDVVIETANQIRQAESDARERIKFDQEQDDRDAYILAEELINADMNTIRSVADANGIEYGTLLRAVRDAQYERTYQAKTLAPEEDGELTESEQREIDTWVATFKSLEDSEEILKNISKVPDKLRTEVMAKLQTESGETFESAVSAMTSKLTSTGDDGVLTRLFGTASDLVDTIDLLATSRGHKGITDTGRVSNFIKKDSDAQRIVRDGVRDGKDANTILSEIADYAKFAIEEK